MPASAQDEAFTKLLWSRLEDLAPMFGLVVRGGCALGPISLGEGGTELLARLARLPGSPPGDRLILQEEHRAQPGFADGTVAHHLTAYCLAYAPNDPTCWLEWSCDPAADRVVHVRFCVCFASWSEELQAPLVDGFRAVLEATYGPGRERKRKPRKNAVRPIDWSFAGGLLTLGCFDSWGRRLVVVELVDPAWADHGYLRLRVLADA